jgi:hypothetical protein
MSENTPTSRPALSEDAALELLAKFERDNADLSNAVTGLTDLVASLHNKLETLQVSQPINTRINVDVDDFADEEESEPESPPNLLDGPPRCIGYWEKNNRELYTSSPEGMMTAIEYLDKYSLSGFVRNRSLSQLGVHLATTLGVESDLVQVITADVVTEETDLTKVKNAVCFPTYILNRVMKEKLGELLLDAFGYDEE